MNALVNGLRIRNTKTDAEVMGRLREVEGIGLSDEELAAITRLPQSELHSLIEEIRWRVAPVPRTNSFALKGSYDLGDLEYFSIYGTGRPGSMARLPNGPFRLFHRITCIEETGEGQGRVTAEYDLTPHSPFFKYHFPGNPIMPGSSELEALAQLTGFFGAWVLVRNDLGDGEGVFTDVGKTRFTSRITPDKKLVRYELTLKSELLPGKGMKVTADGKVYADDRLACRAQHLQAFVATH